MLNSAKSALHFTAITLALLSTCQSIASAASKNTQLDPKPERKPIIELVENIAHYPEMMNLNYLRYAIGRPANETQNQHSANTQYFWYNHKGQLQFELRQELGENGRITDSTFVAYLTEPDIDLEDIQSKYGEATRRYFDQRSYPTSEYSFVPNTVLTFSQPQDHFQVSHAVIAFHGFALPPVSGIQLYDVMQKRRLEALDHHKNERWLQAIPALRAHLLDSPYDVEAHVALADAYKKQSLLNEASAEYQRALKLAPPDKLRDRCLVALRELRLLPNPDEEPEIHKLDLVNHGQRLVQGGNQKQKSEKESTLDIEALDPPLPGPFTPAKEHEVGF